MSLISGPPVGLQPSVPPPLDSTFLAFQQKYREKRTAKMRAAFPYFAPEKAKHMEYRFESYTLPFPISLILYRYVDLNRTSLDVLKDQFRWKMITAYQKGPLDPGVILEDYNRQIARQRLALIFTIVITVLGVSSNILKSSSP